MDRRPSVDTAADVEDLFDVGCTPWEVSMALGRSFDALATACNRANRGDLAAKLRAAERDDRKALRECQRSAA